MSGRRNANRIRGPQSALTDFLAANNISAQQIRDSYEQRTRNTAQQTPAIPQDASNDQDGFAVVPAQSVALAVVDDAAGVEFTAPRPSRKRKHVDEKSTGKEKAGKKSKKKTSKDDDDDVDLSDEYQDLGDAMYAKVKSMPGQLENCEICEKRFTVTAYSKTGPEGGLVCMPCGRELAKENVGAEKKVKRGGAGKTRRKTESNRLDGLLTNGPKSLQQLCIEKVADSHLDIEEFGDLPDTVLNRLSEIFAKRRVLDSRTFRLFLRPDLDAVAIYDCAKLEVEDYKQIFAIVPNVTKILLRNATQFKDAVMKYMLEKSSNITSLQLYAANLISNDMWKAFFMRCGTQLETLKLAWLDASFTDDVVQCMVENCPNLRRLKLKHCRQLTSASLLTLCDLKYLTHLSLHLSQAPEEAELVPLITAVGSGLETLSLENCTEINDTVVKEIETQCSRLSKFRISGIDCVTDAAFVSLFSPESKVPPLKFVDFSSARDVDNSNPDGPADAPVGMASDAFKALMAHSRSRLKQLHVPSCRHISHAAFCDVFGTPLHSEDGESSLAGPLVYPELEEMNLSFCNKLDTAAMKGIFKTCPNLKKLVAFGCFRVEDVIVPKGLVLVGLPRAQDQIEQFGDGDTVAAGMGFDGVVEELAEMNDALTFMGAKTIEVGA